MRVHLLDPGLHGLIGHHHEWLRGLALEARRRGLDVLVACARDAGASVLEDLRPLAEVRPAFSVAPYPARQATTGDRLRTLAGELRALPPADLWFFPSLFLEQAAACAAVASRPPLAGCIHQARDVGEEAGRARWREALGALARCPARTSIGATTPELAAALDPLSPVRVEAWPMPHVGRPAERARERVATIGILGQQRRAKGLQALAGVVGRLLDDGFDVLVHDSGRRLALEPRPGLAIVDGYVADFPALVARCDLVIAPYDRETYRLSASGVAWEALASGIPVIAPSATSPGNLVAACGGGACFDEPTVDSIMDATSRAIAGYPRLAAAAHDFGQRWRERNGVARFLDRALAG